MLTCNVQRATCNVLRATCYVLTCYVLRAHVLTCYELTGYVLTCARYWQVSTPFAWRMFPSTVLPAVGPLIPQVFIVIQFS